MTDIVVVDGIEYLDAESHILANKQFSNAIASDSVNVGGSHYHISLTSEAVAADTILALMHPVSITSNAVAQDTLTVARVANVTSNAVATDTVTAKKKATISIADNVIAGDAVKGILIANLSSTAVAADTATTKRTLSVTSEAVATALATGLAKFHASYTSSGLATDTVDARRSLVLSSSGVAADTVTAKRVGLLIATSDAVATSTVSGSAKTSMALESVAVALATVSGKLTAHLTLLSQAEAEDAVRLPASALPALWTNTTTGAAATWAGLPFNSMIEVAGIVYGAGLDGIYRFTPQVNDNGVKIDAHVTWDLEDFGSPARKRLGHVYVAGYAKKPFVVTITNRQGSFDYLTRLPKGEHTTNYRANTGRGLDATYYRVSVSAPDYFEVKGVIVDYLETGRRI